MVNAIHTPPTANLVHADSHPFNFYVDEEIVIHPAETVSFRIAWQNIADDERYFDRDKRHKIWHYDY